MEGFMESFMTLPSNIRRVLKRGGELYEGLAFNSQSRNLLWVDIVKGIVFEKSLIAPSKSRALFLCDYPSAAIFRENEIVVAADRTITWLPSSELGKTMSLTVPTENYSLKTNETKFDPEGNLWIGMMDRSGSTPGEIWILSKNMEFSQFSKDAGIPNTFVWDSLRDRFYFADSSSGQIFVQAIGTSRGTASPRVFHESSNSSDGVPDGSELIPETGTLLNCRWDGGSIFEIDKSGRVEKVWTVPWRRPTDIVAIGGGELCSNFGKRSAKEI
jgi:L-arabinonolactonase